MNPVDLTQQTEPATTIQKNDPVVGCSGETILKVSLVFAGFLLCAGGITLFFYELHTAGYAVLGAGALLNIATMIGCIVQSVCRARAEVAVIEELKKQEALQQQGADEQRLLELADEEKLTESADIELAYIHEALPERLLNKAASNGDVELVNKFLEKGIDFKKAAQADQLGYSPLHRAINCRNRQKGLETMRALLTPERRELASACAAFQKFTPLHLTACGDMSEPFDITLQKVQLLIEHGAEVNAQDSSGHTSLHVAAEGMSLGMNPPSIILIKFLVDSGAKWDIKNAKGDTPFVVAQENHPQWCEDNKTELAKLNCPFDKKQ